jgi:hypothetical protein
MYAIVLIFKIFAGVHIPERGRNHVDVQTNEDAKIIVHLERDGDKKRKRAHDDDVRNNLSSNSNILSYFARVGHYIQNIQKWHLKLILYFAYADHYYGCKQSTGQR